MMHLRSLMLLSALSFGVAAGCNVILGNEEGTLRRASSGEGGASDAATDAAGSAAFDATVTCPSDKKACKSFNACVTPTDPNFGCGDPSCNACDTTNAQSVVCAGIDGGVACKLTCNAGFADCDGRSENGCEANLSMAGTCGSCGSACSGSTSLCANNGVGYSCVGTCAGAQTKCGSECVDVTSHPSHCGGCGAACPSVPNATATCTSSKCGFQCEALFHQCGGQCVKDSDVSACGASCIDCDTLAPTNTQPTCQAGVCKFF